MRLTSLLYHFCLICETLITSMGERLDYNQCMHGEFVFINMFPRIGGAQYFRPIVSRRFNYLTQVMMESMKSDHRSCYSQLRRKRAARRSYKIEMAIPHTVSHNVFNRM